MRETILVPSYVVVPHLEKSAPKAWVKRALFGMIIQRDIMPFFRWGRTWAEVKKDIFLRDIQEYLAEGESIVACTKRVFGENLAEQLEDDRFPTLSFECSNSEKDSNWPKIVLPGMFIYANHLRLESGLLQATIPAKTFENSELLLEDEELFPCPFEAEEYIAILEGLSFNFDAVELLQPNLTLSENFSKHEDNEPHRERKRGRPRLWDWDGVASKLIAVAQTPDGLPTGPGSQAEIERIVADWFMETAKDTPSTSQIRSHVVRITAGLKKANNP